MRHLFSQKLTTFILLISMVLGSHLVNAQPKSQPEELPELGTNSAPASQASEKKSSQASSTLKVTKVEEADKASETEASDVYLKQIQRIESQVNELKEEIFRSRTRLAILKESVLASGLSGTELRIIHRNDMGANFKLERILYVLDGSPIKQAKDIDGELDRQEEIEILNGTISPGNHQLEVELVYRGNGFGVFSYLQSYRFTLNDVTTFRVKEGNRTTISAVGYEREGLTLELKDRPDIRFDRNDQKLDQNDDAKRKAKATTDSNVETNKSAP
jgi:hypothetical protein